MKRVLIFSILAVFVVSIWSVSVFSAEMSNAELSSKIQELEKKIGSAAGSNISISGAIEFEAGYEKKGDSSTDFSTATVDLGVEGQVNDLIKGSFVFTYNDEDGDIELDEAIIAISSENSPLYANLGQFAVPFGAYNTRFLADPLTLEIGETTQNNVTAGYATDLFDVSATLFNGEVNEAGEDDDNISKYVIAASFTLPENEMAKLSFGGSIISDISDSDGLEEAAGDEVDDFTMGYSVYISAEFMESFFFDAEYVAASDDITLGGEKKEPKAYNLELGFAPMDGIEAAVRYEAGDDTEVETRYGAVLAWSVLDNTTLTGEYLRSEPEDSKEDDTDTITAQIAIEF